jgi:hypothetical protein
VNKYTISNNGNPRLLAESIKYAFDWFYVFLQNLQCDDTDEKFRKLLLDGELRRHMYQMMMGAIRYDLNNVGPSAIAYWKCQYNALGITEQEIETTIRNYKKCYYSSDGIHYRIKQKFYGLRAKLGIRTRIRNLFK